MAIALAAALAAGPDFGPFETPAAPRTAELDGPARPSIGSGVPCGPGPSACGPPKTSAPSRPPSASSGLPRTSTFHKPRENPFYFAFDVYRTTLTIFDGPRCEHRPTCSVYGVQAVQKHGLWGFFLTIDRLLRGADSSALRPLRLVWIGGEPYYRDPLADSDFWMSGGSRW